MTGSAPGALAARASSVETPGDRDVERQREGAARGEAHAQAGEAPRTCADDDPPQLTGLSVGVSEEGIDVLEQACRPAGAFPEQVSVLE